MLEFTRGNRLLVGKECDGDFVASNLSERDRVLSQRHVISIDHTCIAAEWEKKGMGISKFPPHPVPVR